MLSIPGLLLAHIFGHLALLGCKFPGTLMATLARCRIGIGVISLQHVSQPGPKICVWILQLVWVWFHWWYRSLHVLHFVTDKLEDLFSGLCVGLLWPKTQIHRGLLIKLN